MVITVKADNIFSDFFLLKVKKYQHILKTDSTDAWATHYLKGTEVLTGWYYDKIGEDQLNYSLVKGKLALSRLALYCTYSEMSRLKAKFAF